MLMTNLPSPDCGRGWARVKRDRVRANRKYSLLDRFIIGFESKHNNSSAALMRVNHSGEVCAQALYRGQALVTKDPTLKNHLLQSASEEQYHLDWCATRLSELNSHKSYLNPVWGVGSFALGVAAGIAGKGWGLGFIAETEQQVAKHLQSHLTKLPQNDTMSKSILEQMLLDELQHRDNAREMGATELPKFIKRMMTISSKIMTTVSKYL